jgi:hypothetical protein
MLKDCEGMRGGQSAASAHVSDVTNPRGHLEKKSMRGSLSPEDAAALEASRKSYAQAVLAHRNTAHSKLPLRWASVTKPTVGSAAAYGYDPDPPHIDRASKTLAVRELYPRLLYTFSDVVCYITNNPK